MENVCKNWTEWLLKSRFSYLNEEQKKQTINWLNEVKEKVLASADIKKGETVIDIGTGTGLLAFGALEALNGTGKVIFADKFEDCLKTCQEFIDEMKIKKGYEMISAPCENLPLKDSSVDKVLMRSVLVHILDKPKAINEIGRILKKGGKFCAFEPIISSNTRYSDLITPEKITDYQLFKEVEDSFMQNQNDPMCNFTPDTLAQNLNDAGFTDGSVNVHTIESNYKVDFKTVGNWFNTPPSPELPSMRERFLQKIPEAKVIKFIEQVKDELDGTMVCIKSNAVFIEAIK